MTIIKKRRSFWITFILFIIFLPQKVLLRTETAYLELEQYPRILASKKATTSHQTWQSLSVQPGPTLSSDTSPTHSDHPHKSPTDRRKMAAHDTAPSVWNWVRSWTRKKTSPGWLSAGHAASAIAGMQLRIVSVPGWRNCTESDHGRWAREWDWDKQGIRWTGDGNDFVLCLLVLIWIQLNRQMCRTQSDLR